MAAHQADLELMHRVVARDDAAAADLMRQIGRDLYACARRLAPGTQAAEDLLQETMLGILQSAKRYDGRVSVRAWAFSILRNKAVDALRKRGRERVTAEEDPEAHRFDDAGAWREDADFCPWDREAELREVFELCLKGLADNQREVLALRALNQVEGREAADLLGLSRANFRQILHRARQAIRGCVDGKLGETE